MSLVPVTLLLWESFPRERQRAWPLSINYHRPKHSVPLYVQGTRP